MQWLKCLWSFVDYKRPLRLRTYVSQKESYLLGFTPRLTSSPSQQSKRYTGRGSSIYF
eukprot:c37781_g1_i1 orf=122-295(+)